MSNTPLCRCTKFSLSISLWGTSSLFLISGCYEWSSNERDWTSVSAYIKHSFCKHPRWYSCIVKEIGFHLREELSQWFPWWLYKIAFPPSVNEYSCYWISWTVWVVSCFNTLIILTHAIWNFKVDLIFIFLTIRGVKRFFKCLSAIGVTCFDNSLFTFVSHF